MQKILYPADSRGHTKNDWLSSRHTFSFGEYRDTARPNFGALRVFNDDTVAGGGGFGEHPHRNMEIISIPLTGTLEHRDNMGNVHTLTPGDVQLMSAGTGIVHAEYNPSPTEEVHFLQIWITPRVQNTTPGYTQKTFRPPQFENRLQIIISPDAEDHALTILQNAFLARGRFEMGREMNYDLKMPLNGVYVFVLSGSVEVVGEKLSVGDSLAVSGVGHVHLKALETADILLIEIPMNTADF